VADLVEVNVKVSDAVVDLEMVFEEVLVLKLLLAHIRRIPNHNVKSGVRPTPTFGIPNFRKLQGPMEETLLAGYLLCSLVIFKTLVRKLILRSGFLSISILYSLADF